MLHIYQCWLPLFLCPVIVVAPLWCHILSKSHQSSSGLLEGCGEEINKEQEAGILGLGGYLEWRDDPSLPWKPAMPIGLWSCLSWSMSVVHITSSTYLDLVWILFSGLAWGPAIQKGSLLAVFSYPSKPPPPLNGLVLPGSLPFKSQNLLLLVSLLKGIWLLNVGL